MINRFGGCYKIIFPYFLLLFLLIQLSSKEAYANKQNYNLIIKTLNGDDFDLSKMKGKVVIVNFWAYWCSNCIKEMEVLEKIYQQYHKQGLEIIGISIDKKSQLKKILARAKNVSYQNAILSDAIVNDFAEPDSIPQNYIFDKNANLISGINYNLLNKEELDKFILNPNP
jgi:thiol-disulfide isomerase/thioredoxin